ncbi:MAG: hypothetical protein QM778_24135 [Myxococcales bacterium]
MALLAVACRGNLAPAFSELLEARKLSSEMRVHFARAGDAIHRAVLADTDELSREFAQEARDETRQVSSGLDRLESLVKDLDYRGELALVGEFRSEFTQCQKLDEEILSLAVENTNLKAQRLSFGAASQAANELERALDGVPGTHALNEFELQNLKQAVMLGVREIQVLEGPHIATLDENEMRRYESEMATSLTKASAALDQLSRQLDPDAKKGSLEPARQALARFHGVHQEVLALSHRNTDARSLALALGEKRKLDAVCQAKLESLADELKRRNFPATR